VQRIGGRKKACQDDERADDHDTALQAMADGHGGLTVSWVNVIEEFVMRDLPLAAIAQPVISVIIACTHR